jgi:hypothetical protein
MFIANMLSKNITFWGGCRALKFLVDPKYAAMRKRLELGARSRLPALEGGKRGVLEVPGKTRKSGQALLTHTGLHETTQSG